MRFIADNMLGKLAKWLRFLGYDVLYSRAFDDKQLLEISNAENRLLLTRDKELAKCNDFSGLYINSEELEEQFKQVISEFNLALDRRAFTRCPECNCLLKDVDKSQVIDKVPKGVLEKQDMFWSCENCVRYYWRGTHYEQIRKKLEQLFH